MRLVYGEDDDSFWEKYRVLETFTHAADSFVKHEVGPSRYGRLIEIGFLNNGEETLSFPGILLGAKRFDEAKQVVRDFAT